MSKNFIKLATQDHLTGLANRALFLDCLRQGVEKAKQAGKVLGILMIDMDGLKPINDQYGHRLGEEALKEIARRIVNNTRQNDLVARLGGDEFAVILSSVADQELATSVMNRVAQVCGLPFVFENVKLTIGASVGLAFYPVDAAELNQLIECADQKMYAHKRQKKSLSLSI